MAHEVFTLLGRIEEVPLVRQLTVLTMTILKPHLQVKNQKNQKEEKRQKKKKKRIKKRELVIFVHLPSLQ